MIHEGVRIPPELEGYGNGCLPDDVLDRVGVGGFRAWLPTCRAFTELRLRAAADGFKLTMTGAYRSLEAQRILFEARYSTAKIDGRPTKTWGGVTWWQKPGTAQAATPGTSTHGWGLALDLAQESKVFTVESIDPVMLAWLRDKAPALGWAETVPGEAWHWVLADWARYLATPNVVPTAPSVEPEEDDVPYLLIRHQSHDEVFALFGSGAVRHIGPTEFAWYQTKGVPYDQTMTDDAEYDRLRAHV